MPSASLFTLHPVAHWVEQAGGHPTLVSLVERVIGPALSLVVGITLAFFAVKLLKRTAKKTAARLVGDLDETNATNIDEVRRATRISTLSGLGVTVGTVVIWTVAAMMSLSAVGLEITPLLAGAGAIGVAFGFGAQSVVSDFLAGILMLIEDQYGIGDIIDVGDAVGVVEQVGLRSTEVRDVHGTLWFVPNGEIRRVGNMSQQWARAVLDIGVAYDTDLDEAAAVIDQVSETFAADEQWADTLLDMPTIWGVQNLGADSVDLRVAVKTLPSQQFSVSREFRRRIKDAFDEVGIEIPFAQRTLWLRDATNETPPALPSS